jgi:hypothetical protein
MAESLALTKEAAKWRSALYLNKILNGAEQLGLTIPPNVLTWADRVIQ